MTLQYKQNIRTLLGNIKNVIVLALKQERKACHMLAFPAVSKTHTNKLNIFLLCTYIDYIKKVMNG